METKGRARYDQIGAGPNLGQIKPQESLWPAAIEKQDKNKIINKIKCNKMTHFVILTHADVS